jgi:hypothetical protein
MFQLKGVNVTTKVGVSQNKLKMRPRYNLTQKHSHKSCVRASGWGLRCDKFINTSWTSCLHKLDNVHDYWKLNQLWVVDLPWTYYIHIF